MNTRTLTLVKKLYSSFDHVDSHILIMGDFNSPHSPMARTTAQNLNRDILELTDIIKQIDLTDIYRIFHLHTKEYYVYSAPL